MGIIKIKSLSLHTLPWYCFHLPLTSSSSSSSPSTTATATASSSTVRVIASDGRVKVFDSPISAAELMRQHPLHLVCSSDSFFIGQKVPPLSASDRLQPGHSYFLLPSHFFHSVLSFVTLSSSLIVNRKGGAGGTAVLFRSFDVRRTEKGMLQVRVKDESMSMGEAEENRPPRPRICDSEELEKEYRQLVGLCRRWKPKLEAITEAGLASKSSRTTTLLLLLIGRNRKHKGQNC